MLQSQDDCWAQETKFHLLALYSIYLFIQQFYMQLTDL